MTKSEIESKCKEYGEFYIQFEYIKKSFKGRKTTYIQGTMEFDESQDKYLAKRYAQENIKPADKDHILVFSRTGNVFRYIPVSKVRRVTSLQYELDKARPV
ncbi:hypothetical protein P13BB106kb_p088 [Pectobacterium phage DU_PP_V]|uniref:Uncharacterized protein n=1 Tax=Pectobacterium phage DU_PP_V TaxID=2041492 RepID=A0A2D2W700_9CAUD|nr:hypothetical protein HOS40_gp081 [Pectobacterium phage DU_PP_V]ATS94072.1 hypothetical protein P13BB106kb_p088 [Pectobacterium phage DU_PP_V]